METSYEKEIKISAVDASFEVKDKLKENDYRWDAPNRVWVKTVLGKALEPERVFLKDQIYKGNVKHE